MNLPNFKYHPDPLSTGSIAASDLACECCGKRTGYIYTPGVYGLRRPENLCPWCIADGSAHAKYDCEFTPRDGVGGDVAEWVKVTRGLLQSLEPAKLEWGEVSDAVTEEVAFRTPGFAGCQDEKWWTHCDDAGAFLGFIGDVDPVLLAEPPAADFVAEIKEMHEFTEDEWNWFINSPDKEHDLTGYVFRCLHCGTLGGYADQT